MAGFIGPFVVGITCIVFGIANMRGNISSLHSYHRHRVSEEDRVPFGKMVGLGMIIIGISMLVFGGLSLATELTENNVFVLVGGVILIVSVIVGLALSFYAMIKYNKGIF